MVQPPVVKLLGPLGLGWRPQALTVLAVCCLCSVLWASDECTSWLCLDFLERWESRVIVTHCLAALMCSPTCISVTSVSLLKWRLPWLPPSPVASETHLVRGRM